MPRSLTLTVAVAALAMALALVQLAALTSALSLDVKDAVSSALRGSDFNQATQDGAAAGELACAGQTFCQLADATQCPGLARAKAVKWCFDGTNETPMCGTSCTLVGR